MVLENVNEMSPDSFTDNPSPDQTDPYASSSPSSSSGVRFDATSLPQPLPVIGTFMGFSDRAVRMKTEITLKFAERKLGRNLYSDEAQALAFHIYQLEQTKSYFAATGAAAGAYRAYATMATNRYPFYQPKAESIDPTKFGFIRGPMAPMVRHAWRFSLYLLVAGQMGSIIGQLIAQPLAAVNTSKDPKLEQFGNELKAATVAEQSKTAVQAREIQERKREFERQTKDRNGMGPSPQGAWGKQQPPARPSEDDMSPTAGNEVWGTQPSASGSWDSFSSQADQSTPQQSQGPPSSEAWNRRAPPTRAPPASSSPFDDDASPTGGMFQDEVNNGSAQQQSRPGESTWDRLRRGAAPAPGQRPVQQPRRQEPERREQREGSTLGDSFTFVEGEEERKQSRERAQREFDERLERERQGRDFSEDQGKRW
ncbi:hypothetical protein HBI56_144400 [Parastagonospora nodorum]|uniref:Uncharacterized protein n=1 Tax=Phaeosphaeria nodorum (strain SN15 / ATCC MYA-4574 / FGSC 10173) TaxID=321614 RepID=A0A7U2I3C4_PHANO|nr:hypothetical protein HBH56_032620 [Parastagonospora nodorum]QRD00305.1 hypothetical protein JI435_071770 [Parastagonospora nodorum SN15]KAH3933962.1 hypothetical protein HBH54_066820 [Parastagonospora nodorum]KAH3979772.1 hypothetical protein HBH51_054250 [Parastagonospora nodorum]KAH4002172.1 hypothetical protein HBI10_083810 [Parastagonospora nodorum]